MQATNLSIITNDLIASYGNTAKNVIQAYRAGGDRMVDFLEQRWDSAFQESSPQLTAEVRKNALNAQKVLGSYYAKGVAMTTEGAESVVDKFIKFAADGIEQVAANASRFEEKTGVTALNQLAVAAVPAAVAVSKLVTQLEQKSGELVSKIAGDNVAAATVKRATPFKQARSRKAA